MKLDDTLIYKVQVLSRRLDAALGQTVAENDAAINYAQYKVLVAVHEADKTSITGVANWLDISVPTSSHLCRKLEAKKYISIKFVGQKTKKIALTRKGIKTLERLNPLLEKVLDDCFDVLSANDQRTFIASIDTLQEKINTGSPTC